MAVAKLPVGVNQKKGIECNGCNQCNQKSASARARGKGQGRTQDADLRTEHPNCLRHPPASAATQGPGEWIHTGTRHAQGQLRMAASIGQSGAESVWSACCVFSVWSAWSVVVRQVTTCRVIQMDAVLTESRQWRIRSISSFDRSR